MVLKRFIILLSFIFIFDCHYGFAEALKIEPGIVINKQNCESYLPELKTLLWPGAFHTIINGVKNGWISLPVVEKGKLKAPENFIKWTLKNKDKCRVISGNKCVGWKAGLPFTDPKNGAELAINMEKVHQACEQYYIIFDYLLYDKNSNLERSFALFLYGRYWMGRTQMPPVPEEPGNNGLIRLKESIVVFRPFDVKGFIQLRVRYDDVQKDDEVYSYIPAIRRLRRLTGADVTDPILGSDVPNDDFECIRQKINPKMTFNTLPSKNFLVPAFPSKKPVRSKDMRNCIQVNWQIRQLRTLEIYPNDPNYCYKKRVIYIDPAGMLAALWGSENYDMKGRLWRGWSQVVHARDPETYITAKPWYSILAFDHLSGHSSLLDMIPESPSPVATKDKFNISALVKIAR